MFTIVTALTARLRALFRRGHTDAEIDEEIRFHLDREIERNLAHGMAPTAARDAARRALGNVTVAKEQARAAWGWTWLEDLSQDVTFALRTFKRAPAYAVTVVATIGLGLGLLTTVFTLFNAYALRPVAVRDPYSLYDVGWHSRDGHWHRFSWAQYQAFRANGGVFAQSFGYEMIQARIHAEPMFGQLVTDNYFEMLAVPPALGRTLIPDDAAAPGSGAVIVLSYDTWQAAFGGDSGIVGKSVPVNGVPLRVVGVARRGFGGLGSVPLQFWIPITMAAALDSSDSLLAPNQPGQVRVVGRITPGMTVDQANAALTAWLRAATVDLPPLGQANDVVLVSRGTSIPMTLDLILVFAPIAAAFGLVMLTACANVANMMLARGMARQREIGIRLALGAGRRRLIRQLLTEAALLAIPSAFVGFGVSRATVDLGTRAMFATMPNAYTSYVRIVPLEPDVRVLAFMMAVAVLAAIAFGLVPALQATRPSVVQATRGDFDTEFRPSRLRNALVVAQITVSVLLLIIAGVLLRGARNTERLDPGIRTRNVVQIEVLDRARALSLERLRAEPIVSRLASAARLPLDGGFDQVSVGASDSTNQAVDFNVVSPEYFETLDIPIDRGRNFTQEEARAKAPVVVVSAGAARRLWPDRNPIGQSLIMSSTMFDRRRLSTYHRARVIGIAHDVVAGFIGRDVGVPVVYYPQPLDANASAILVRVSGEASVASVALDRVLIAADAGAVQEVHTLESSLAVQVYPFRAAYWLAAAVGGIALLLTLTGVYGVLSYAVSQRTREFGVRTALGASPPALIALVLRQSTRLAVIGIVVGTAVALGLSRLFASVLVVVDTFDVAAYAGGTATVFLACVVAAYVPSRRAALVDPVEALRADS